MNTTYSKHKVLVVATITIWENKYENKYSQPSEEISHKRI